MPTAPTLVAFASTETTVATGVAVTTASISWQTGDVVVLFAQTDGESGGETIAAPSTTGSGITFTQQQLHQSAGSDTGAGCWAAVASANSSGTFSTSATHTGVNTSRPKRVSVYIWRGSAGIGNSAITASPSSTKTVSLTPTGADGAICWVVGDWNADATVAFSPTATTHSSGSPGPTASPVSVQDATLYTSYVACLDDQASSGANSYGVAGSGAGPFTIVAIEVKAGTPAAAGSSTVQAAQSFPPFAPPFTVPTAEPFQLLGDAAGTTPITLTDSGAAADSLSVLIDYGSPVNTPGAFPPFTAPFVEPNAVPFQLQGDSSGQTNISLTDAGTGDDSSLTITAAVPLTDSGTGDDSSFTITAAVPLSDTGAAADSLSVVVLEDPNQAIPLFAPMFLEPNYGAFQLFGDSSGQTSVSLTDAGAGADTLSTTAAVPLSDTAAGDDSSLTITAAVPLTDTGAAADALTVVVTYDPNQAQPLGFPAFTAPFIEPTAIPFQLLGDTSSTPQISLTDTGTAADGLTVTAAVPLTDSGTGDDSSLTVAAAAPLSDTAAGADAATVTAAVPLTDSGSAADSLSVLVSGSTDSAWPMVFIPPAPRPFGDVMFVPFQLQGSSEIIIPTAVLPITVTGSTSAAASVTGSSTAAVSVTGSTAPAITVH